MEPITREEFYLNKLTGEDQTTPEPVTREEQYLSRLCGADNIIPQTPETRREAYLAALCGEEVETPEPVTRIEQYMNFAAGKSQSKPEKAITREEMYWDKYKGGAVPEEKTVQGDIIHIMDATGDNAVALSVVLTPTQDLHGYDHPWPAGGGVNIATPESSQSYSIVVANNNGVVSVTRIGNATNNPRSYFTKKFEDIGLIEGETYTAYCYDSAQNSYGCGVYNGSGGMSVLDIHASPYTFVYSASTMSTRRLGIWSNSPNNLPLNTTIYFHVVLVKGSTVPTVFSPYSNICPINGFEGVTVHVSETQTGGTTYPVTFTEQGTVYGGTIDVVSGELKITWGYIASYNGETLPGVWMSSKEVYAEGTSPSLGAEVSYILSTPITATIDPTTIALNEGENYVWTEEGTTTLTYMAKAAQRVLAMNRTLQKNLNAIELKKGGDVK